MADNGSSKRRRTTSPDGLHINNLPDTFLSDVANYLPAPSRALFASAMTAPSSSWSNSTNNGLQRQQPSATSKAILSSSPHNDEKWEVLDFGSIEKSLASRLTDGDIRGVLACIDAGNRLRTLNLGGCVNITGCGLEPLRDSVVLAQIDLGLVGEHESPLIEPEPLLSETEVLPILTSIIDADGVSLKHVQLPKAFRTEPNVILDNFLRSYDQFLRGRGSTCPRCDNLIELDEWRP
ncbi:hypothetical protein ACHAXR_010433, partial [Thalassiosira sp. AJA248-18]